MSTQSHGQLVYDTTVGTQGTGNVQFNFLEGIASGPTGKIFVADRGNDRVQILNADYSYSGEFGSAGSGNGQFNNVVDLDIDNAGNIYALDRSDHRLQVFNSSFTYQFQIGTTGTFGSGNSQFRFPESVAVDNDNNLIYIADRGNDRVQVFNTSGSYIRTIPVTYPSDVHVASTGNIFVVALTTDMVYEYTSTGILVNSINGGGGSGNGQFDIPTGIAIDAADNLYVVDRNNDRIAVFNSSGVWQYNITTPNASGANGFTLPTDATIDGNGNLLVTEVSEHHFEVFASPVVAPTVTLSVTPASVAENGGTLTLKATLSNTYTSDVTVNLVYSGTATGSGVDYSGPASIIVPAGNTSADANITIVNDATDEDDESIIVDISSVTNGTESGTQQVTATITDDDAAPALSVNDPAISEALSPLSFTVSLSAASAKTISVNYLTADNTALAGADYSSVSGTLTFNPGETTKTVNVPVLNDVIDENDESFALNLSSPVNATIADSQGIATITDDDAQPTLTLSTLNSAIGEDGGSSYIRYQLSAPSGKVVTFNFVVLTGNVDDATEGVDYTLTQKAITIPIGQVLDSIRVTSIADALVEGDETVRLDANSVVNATDGTSPVIVTIQDADAAALSINDVTETEGNTLTFTVTLNNTVQGGLTVDYATSDNTAIAGSDYTAASGTLSFTGTAGETQTFAVNTTGDTQFEADETFNVGLSNISGLSNGQNVTFADATGVGTIVNDDTAPAISINDVTAGEGAGTMTFTVSLSASSGLPVSVAYATADNTAIAGTDYTATSGTLNFAAGETSKTVNVAITDDSADEADETLFFNLSSAVNASIADSQGTGTITDNDTPPVISVADANASEAAGQVTFSVSLSGSSTNTITVAYATLNGTASAGTDYTTTTGTLTFNPGETTKSVNVPVINDDIDEGDENFVINLSSPVNATIADSQGTGVINDDDTFGVTLSTTTVNVQENGTNGSYTIVLDSEPTADVVVSFITDSQIQAISSLTFTPGNWDTPQSVTVVAINDLIDEANPHTGTIQHSLASSDVNYNGASVSDVTASIQDDDAAGLFVTASTVDVTEDGATDTYRIRLTSEPVADVTVSFVTDAQLNTIADITFTPSNWNNLQTVTVAATDDDVAEGSHTSVIQHSISSTDPFYDGLNVSGQNVTATIADNDTAGITLSKTSVTVAEDGTVTDSYTIALTSEPVSPVTISFNTGADITAIADVVFTANGADAWDTPKTINVTAVDDGVCEGPETVSITHSATSTDGTYDGIDLSSQSVTVDILDDGPATAAAIIDQASQEVCESTFALSANAPASGETGAWSSTTSGVTFTSPSANTTSVNLVPGANNITWTISKGGCEISTSITITNNEVTTVANIIQSDMGICSNSVALSASAVDAGESGVWSSASGLVNFSPNASAQNVTATDIPVGEETIYYTVRRGGSTICEPSIDSVSITNYDVTASVNTANTEVCDGTASLSAQPAPSGITGTWTGPAGAVFSPDINSPNVSVSNIPAGAQTFTWTLDLAACGNSSDNVVITNNEVTTIASISNPAGEICSSTLELTGNTPAAGEIGTWTGPGSVVFDDANSPTAVASNIPSGTVTFTWTISRGGCTPSVATVNFTNNTVQSTVNIMNSDNSETCDGTVALSATNLLSGESGVWTGPSGVIISSPTSNNTNATALVAGDNQFIWSVTRGGCVARDTVVIVNNELQAVASISTVTQEVCVNTFAIEASTPANGETGTWTGPAGVTFADANNPVTTVNNLAAGANTLTWTITRGGCSSNAQVTLTNNQVNTVAQITSPGSDSEVCNNTISLTAGAADTSNGESGQWSGPSGVIFNPTASSASVTVSNLLPGDNVFVWTISKGGCTPSTDTVTITNNQVLSTASVLTPAQQTCDASIQLQANAIAAGETGTWTGPAGVTFSPNANDREAVAENLIFGENKLYWSIGRGGCDPSVDSVTITRNEPAAVVTDPVSQVLCPGDQLVLSVDVSGTSPFTYEWRKNGVRVPGANQQTLTIDNITASNAGTYTVRVDNICGVQVTSGDAVVSVNDPVQITAQPQTDITCEGGDISFGISAGGTGLTIRWQENDGAGWSDIAEGGVYSGTQTATLTISGTPASLNGYQYRAVASGDCGDVISDPATLNQYDPLTGGTINDDQQICFNTVPDQLITLIASEGGDGTYDYQWEVSVDNVTFTDIAGATGENYQPEALTQTTYYRRRVTAGSSCGTELSNVLTIEVLPGTSPGTIAGDQTVCFNTVPATLTSQTDASGGGSITYQWEESVDGTLWDEIAGANSPEFTPGALTVSTMYRRKVVYNGGGCGEEYSNSVTVDVFSDILAGEIGNDQVVASTATPDPILSIAPAQGGDGNYTYQWQSSTDGLNWTDIAGANAESYSPDNTMTTFFRRVVTSGSSCGSAITNEVLVRINNAPVASDISINLDEDVPFNLSEATFLNGYVDNDGDDLQQIRIETVPSNGELQINGVPVFAGDIIDVADLTEFFFIPDTDYSGSDLFAYSAGDGTEFSNSASVNLNVRPVNDPPVISPIDDIVIGVGEVIPVSLFTVTDPDSDLSEITVTASTDNNALINSLDVTDNGGGDYSLTITVNNAAGIAIVTVTASDGQDQSTQTFLFQLEPRITDVPNLLIINGAERNRTWGISHFGISDPVRINVYDESGTVLFETTDPSREWDGTYNGDLVSNGVYYYTIEIDSREEVLQGALKVIR
ncbi:Calx-beta domain-containing protein [Roseivirga sp. BDSF3-8]|uniref:Calx-beta domain-containing protein n=1 Tax=Roseivirga sp. BDSF3-8 TaxID=3241598 RepID=UPI0035326E11